MKIKLAFEEILLEIDRDKKYINKEVFENTPSRMEEFYTEFFSGLKIDPYKFLKNYIPTNNNDIIIEKNISFYSMCEHHLLPFFGKVSIAYIPNKKIIGFGEIIKVIETFSKRPQLQERLTENIVETIFKGLDCKGVYLLIEAEHLCMTMRGVKKPGSKIITIGTRGLFEKDNNKRLEIATLLKN